MTMTIRVFRVVESTNLLLFVSFYYMRHDDQPE